MIANDGDMEAWKALAPAVPAAWFVRSRSSLHGVRHTQRVHIHAQRLTAQLDWPAPDRRLVLAAALWHDIGRLSDEKEPEHGAGSAKRALSLDLTAQLPASDVEPALFAVTFHSLDDEEGEEEARGLAQPERALRMLWLLKDADALDRVRLGGPWAIRRNTLRFSCTEAHIDFADELLAAFG
jgi:HD superfamily phosphodiesterase